MAGQSSNGWWKYLILGALLLAFFVLFGQWLVFLYRGWFPIPEWNSTQRVGYLAATFLLLLGLIGLSFPKAHLFHHQIFRFMAYSAIIIFVLTLCYSMLLDIIR